MKKKKKNNLLTVIAVLLIVAGSSILIYDFVTKKMRDANVEQHKISFLEDIANPPEKDNDIEPDVYGLLEIDSLDISLPVSTDGNFEDLYNTLVAYSEAPKPPKEGNFAIAGHNGACGLMCKFKDLHEINPAEKEHIRFIDRANTYVYEIYYKEIVDKSDIWVLDPKEGETTLTLITCRYPSWTHPDRLVVQAKLVEVIPH